MGSEEGTGSPFTQRQSLVDLNTKIMIAAIISVTTIILILTLLHLYTRSLLSRQDHRRRTAIQRLLIASAASRPSPKTGLHPSIIAAIPASAFTMAEGGETVLIECSVCLSVVQEGETVRTLPNCHHIFHAECIDKWLGGRSSCPICRAEAAPRRPMLLTPEPRESPVGAAGERPPAERMRTKIGSGDSLSSYPLGSFRKMVGSREIVSCGLLVQSCEGEVVQDLERQ